MKKQSHSNKTLIFIDYFVIIITAIFIGLTLVFWPALSIGWYVVALTALLGVFTIILSAKKGNKVPALVWIIAYLVFLEIYFFLFRVNLPDSGPLTFDVADVNWGTAFVAFVIMGVTPFLIAMNSFVLFANISRLKK